MDNYPMPQMGPMNVQATQDLMDSWDDAKKAKSEPQQSSASPFDALMSGTATQAKSAPESNDQDSAFERLMKKNKTPVVEKPAATKSASTEAKAAPEMKDMIADSPYTPMPMKDAIKAYNRLTDPSTAPGAFQGLKNDSATLSPLFAAPFSDATIPELWDQQKAHTRDEQSMLTSLYGDKWKGPAAAGEIVGSALPVGKTLKAIKYGADALKDIPYLGSIARFVTGGVESNRVLNPMSGAVDKGSTIGNKIMQMLSGAAGGTGAGAIATLPLLGGQPDVPVMQQLKYGAGTGAAVGAGAPMAGSLIEGARNMASNIKEHFSPVEVQAKNKLMQNMARDLDAQGVPMSEIPNRLAQMGPSGMVMDAGGENTVDLARSVAGMPGPGKEKITKILEARNKSQYDRLTGSVLRGLGVDENATYNDALDSLIKSRATKAAPLYDEAYKGNQNIQSNVIDRILETDDGQKALKFAAHRMNNDMALMGVPDKELAEQARLVGQYPKGGISSGLKLRTLDLVKQGLDDQYAVLAGKEPGAAKSVDNLRKGLLAELDKLDLTKIGDNRGKYALAREAYAGPSQSMEALEAGKDFIQNRSVNPKTLQDMSEDDKGFFRIGVAQKMRDALENTPDAADSVKRIFGSPAKRKALESAFPSKEAFEDFEKTVNHESKFFENYAKVTRGSHTFEKFAAARDAGIPVSLDDIMTGSAALSGHTGAQLGLIARGARAVADKFGKPPEISPEIANKLAELLTSKNPDALRSLVQTTPRSNRLSDYMDYLTKGVGGNVPTLPGLGAQYTNQLTAPQENR